MKIHSHNAGLAMNYSSDVVQEVTELYMEVRGAEGCHMDRHADKLVRDAFIWNHLAGDSVQRMKVARSGWSASARAELSPAALLSSDVIDRLEGADHVQHLLGPHRKRRLALDRVGKGFQQHAQRIDMRKSLSLAARRRSWRRSTYPRRALPPIAVGAEHMRSARTSARRARSPSRRWRRRRIPPARRPRRADRAAPSSRRSAHRRKRSARRD